MVAESQLLVVAVLVYCVMVGACLEHTKRLDPSRAKQRSLGALSPTVPKVAAARPLARSNITTVPSSNPTASSEGPFFSPSFAVGNGPQALHVGEW
eukprot:CAMPEP_0173369332 /NCGR_PEP_ID=MMETSP1144-20121109/26013_1 /TAXON_ID=483371 /ORGANISM="non described non described, Strain CCMP2298" /LENGTH=95 /DNA_ID=CAMNT_0014320643 /DNA_START=562 /DNA_END=846 /DNA_ORIENTATION=+